MHNMDKKSEDIIGRVTGKGIYPHQFAWALLLPLRNLWLSPKTLVNRLGLKENYNVLEIGCGPGYFSPAVARSIPQGILYMTDIQPEMVELAQKRLAQKGITNVRLQTCDGTVLDYPDSTFDVIFLITVLGEISEPSLYAQEMARILKPGGIVSVSEQGGDPDSLSVPEIESILKPAGFVADRVFGSGRTFTANFKKGNS